MHYTIKISDESKLTSNKESDDKILEYQEDNNRLHQTKAV